MPKGKKLKAKKQKRPLEAKPKLQFRLSPHFKADLGNLTDDDRGEIINVLQKCKDDDLFLRKKHFKVLREFKGRKLWYFRAGSDCRLTATYDTDGNLWLLSIESHDTLKLAAKRVIDQVRKLGL